MINLTYNQGKRRRKAWLVLARERTKEERQIQDRTEEEVRVGNLVLPVKQTLVQGMVELLLAVGLSLGNNQLKGS